ncbi:MAG: hypothetical protein D3907_01595 [Candidatus Electrothrix sp. AUS3]|nr:hypothetical protein [Candidatus Electrothrix gigas]
METPDEFLHDFIEIGTHKIFIYMRCHGKWVKRINKGMIVYTDVFLDYPKCTRCGQYAESSHYIEKENFFGFKYKACKVTNKKVEILSQQQLVQLTASRITALINKGLGF